MSASVELSVNLNKVAWLRNARGSDRPDLLAAARTVIDAGAYGVTVHPRPDQRHITTTDVGDLADLLATKFAATELNIEGNPLAAPREDGYPGLDALVARARPNQVTLVPDSDSQLTSDHGWDLGSQREREAVAEIVARYQGLGARVSLFMDPDLERIRRVPQTGADRIELYTESFAAAVKRFGSSAPEAAANLATYSAAAELAGELGLGVNAGHDLDLGNLRMFCRVPGLLEVSIGHALISDALDMGLENAVRAYLDILRGAKEDSLSC